MDGYKLYVSTGPNPRIARMFAAEKGLALPEVEIDIGAGENRQPPFLALNPAGETPALRCPDGQVLGEATVICELLEELGDGPRLLGETPLERARIRMWVRRVDLKVAQPFTGGFRFGPALAFFKPRVRTMPQASDDLFTLTREGLAWIERQASGQLYLTGPTLSLADIQLYCFLSFNAERVKRPLTNGLSWIPDWFDRMDRRPSAEATRR